MKQIPDHRGRRKVDPMKPEELYKAEFGLLVKELNGYGVEGTTGMFPR
jgi:hypothetical protein